MLIGVVTFSLVTGTLASIISSYDSNEALIKEKIAVLNEIYDEYDIGVKLFGQLAKTIKYDSRKKQKDLVRFLDELPHELKLQLSA